MMGAEGGGDGGGGLWEEGWREELKAPPLGATSPPIG